MAQAVHHPITAAPAAHPIPRFGRGVSLRRRYHPKPGLADDLDFLGRGQHGHDWHDPELELCTWPELVDQTRIGRWGASPHSHDDAEDDDPDTGIEDEGCDAREEDGI